MSVFNKFLVASLASLISSVAFANFAGTWAVRDNESIVFTVEDDGQSLTAAARFFGLKLSLEGEHQSSTLANIKISKTTIFGRCKTVLFGTWELLDENTVQHTITGSDGNCDLPTDYTDNQILDRQ